MSRINTLTDLKRATQWSGRRGGRGGGGGRSHSKNRRCPRGSDCPYQHEYQHQLEFHHEEGASEPPSRHTVGGKEEPKAQGGGGGRPRSQRDLTRFPGSGQQIGDGSTDADGAMKKRRRRSKTAPSQGRGAVSLAPGRGRPKRTRVFGGRGLALGRGQRLDEDDDDEEEGGSSSDDEGEASDGGGGGGGGGGGDWAGERRSAAAAGAATIGGRAALPGRSTALIQEGPGRLPGPSQQSSRRGGKEPHPLDGGPLRLDEEEFDVGSSQEQEDGGELVGSDLARGAAGGGTVGVVACPLCSQRFQQHLIETHAATCMGGP